jgi:hypothetical protein
MNVNVHIYKVWKSIKKLNFTYETIRLVSKMRNDQGYKIEKVNYVNGIYHYHINTGYKRYFY